MRTPFTLLAFVSVLVAAGSGEAAAPADLQPLLEQPIIGSRQALVDVQEFCDGRVPRMPALTSARQWEEQAARMRREVLERVVYRGEAARWRDAPAKVEWLENLPGGEGYRLRKLRYEAVPGLWIPAILYEPENLTGKVPVHLAVNGHEGIGKSVGYKQVRCINLAKRGMIVLNPEWLGMGQLRQPNYSHTRMNQLDLCGTSGLAPFYLSMKRGLDLLLDHPHADPQRVAVSGLSGGGWQTIIISALDTRVTLANPVAGYSSFRTRMQHFKDLGDSEQTPVDLATVVDYTHLTAMLAPRAALLTYNAQDECCFEAGYALPPLRNAAGPVYRLLEKEHALRFHINEIPGTHNFLQDNREAFYRAVGQMFYPRELTFNSREIPCGGEVKPHEQLLVELPPNANFNSLALALGKDLPRGAPPPREKAALASWQQARRAAVRDVVKYRGVLVVAQTLGTTEKAGVKATAWKLKVADAWTLPCVELVQGTPRQTAVLIADGGRKSTAAEAQKLLDQGCRVLAVDPWYFGEAQVESRAWLWALLISTVGERPLGVQASQVAAVARWAQTLNQDRPITLVAIGPRTSLIALTAAALEEKAVGSLTLHQSLGSLKEALEQNMTVDQKPELFCFGLLEACDVQHLAALLAPRPLTLVNASPRARQELAPLKDVYAALGVEWNGLP